MMKKIQTLMKLWPAPLGFSFFTTVALVGLMVACGRSRFDDSQSQAQEQVAQAGLQPDGVLKTGTSCFINSYSSSRRTESVTGVDLWLVVDASNSFDRERVAIAQALVNGFTQATQLGLPVYVSVLAAHSPLSPDSTAIDPVFYKHGKEPLTVVLKPNMTDVQKKEIQKQLLVKLNSNMRLDPHRMENKSQLHSGADEMGLLALYNATLGAENHEDRALVVMFQSDENDVCMGPEFNDKHDRDENNMYQKYCVPNKINPERVYRQLRQFAGHRPLVVTSVVYTGENKIVNEAHNSLGVGYLEMVKLSHGKAFDLAPAPGVNYSSSLSKMSQRLVQEAGEMTSTWSTHFREYTLFSANHETLSLEDLVKDDNGQPVIQVYLDGQLVDHDIDEVHNFVIPKQLGNNLSIHYCVQ